MPKLIILAPCDNVLINKDRESASLIVIMTQILFPAPPPQNLPVGVMAPMRWFVFCQWEAFPEEVGFTFEQRVTLSSESDDDPLISFDNTFTPESGKVHQRVITGFFGFPFAAHGTHRIRVSVRKKDEGEWVEAGSYPIEIIYPQHNDNELGLNGSDSSTS